VAEFRSGGPEPEDLQLHRLKRRWQRGELSARRTAWTVSSSLLVCVAGVMIAVGAMLPWVSIAGVSVMAVQEGGPDGAAAWFACLVALALVVLGAVSAVGRRGAPRFLHWLTFLLVPLVFVLVRYRADILGNFVSVHNADVHTEGAAVEGAGVVVIYAGLALAVVAPLLSLRQALRVLRL
jgi:hypothetical protein